MSTGTGDIAATRSAVRVYETILDGIAVCARGVHFHRGFEHAVRALDDIYLLQIGLRVGVIGRKDDVGCLSPTRPMRCGQSQRGENCAGEELFHVFLDLTVG